VYNKLIKKIISLLLVFLIVTSLWGTSFASTNNHVIIGEDGAEYKITIVNENINEKIMIFEYGDSKMKSVLNKNENTLSIYKLNNGGDFGSNAKSSIEEKFISNVDLNLKAPNQYKSYSISDSYISNHFSGYSYDMNGAYGMLRFKLTVPNDSLITPYVNSSNRIYQDSFDFRSYIQSADSYFDSMLLSGVGFIPGYAVMIAIAEVLEDGQVTGDDIATVVMLILTNSGWMGTFLNTALVISYGSLSAAQLFNARTEFRNVKNAY
jgi:hypothetical protein